MSFNRENVTWVSRDGTWNVGFFEVCWEDPDGDPEWDVEYAYETFDDVYTGYATEDAAWKAATEGRGNPGGSNVHSTADEQTDRYDAMAAACKAARPPRASNYVSFGGRVW